MSTASASASSTVICDRDALVDLLWKMTEKATRVVQTAIMQSGATKVKGYDGRIGTAVEFYSCETGMYTSRIRCEGLPLVDIFGPTYFAVGKNQNIRTRFICPKQENAFLAECLKAHETAKSTHCIDAVPISTFSLPSDIEYMTNVKTFLATRIAEFSDEQVSTALKMPLGKEWITEFQAILASVRATKLAETAAKPVERKRNFARFNKTSAVGGAGASS